MSEVEDRRGAESSGAEFFRNLLASKRRPLLGAMFGAENDEEA